MVKTSRHCTITDGLGKGVQRNREKSKMGKAACREAILDDPRRIGTIEFSGMGVLVKEKGGRFCFLVRPGKGSI